LRKRLERGLVQIYTGNGKGKTTAALGLCLRALGRGFKVCFIQFLKGHMKLGDGAFLAFKCVRDFEYASYGTGQFVTSKPSRRDLQEASRAFRHAKEAIMKGGYDVVVLDEITHAVNLGLIDVKEVIELIRNKPLMVEIVLTGRAADRRLIDIADLVTEMKEVKHPFSHGVQAREGIEF
jgi:cob(I)alamin adenosyltransferase